MVQYLFLLLDQQQKVVNRKITNCNIRKINMLSGTSPQSGGINLTSTSPLPDIIMQLDTKFAEVSAIKDMLATRIRQNPQGHSSDQIRATIAAYIHTKLTPYLQVTLRQYHQGNLKMLEQVCSHYQREQTRRTQYYQAEIEELKDQIRRQYKVIGLMKQQVEDLMVLIKEQRLEDGYSAAQFANSSSAYSEEREESEEDSPSQGERREQNSSRSSPNNTVSNSRDRRFQLDLEIIQEETERTLLSSQRSHGNPNAPPNQEGQEPEPQKIESEKVQQSDSKSQSSAFIKIENQYQEHGFNENDMHNGYSQFKEQEDFYEENLSPLSYDFCHGEPKNSQKSELSEGRSFKNESKKIDSNNTVTQFMEEASPDPTNSKKGQAPPPPAHLQSIFFPEEEPEFNHKQKHLGPFPGRKVQMLSHKFTENINNESSSPHQMSVSKSLANSKMDLDMSCQDQQCALTEGNSRQNTKKQLTKKAFNTEQSEELQRNMERKETTFVKKNNKLKNNEAQRQVKLVDVTNQDRESYNSEDQNLGKPKTKQFLEEFRKTFNKCLNSMQVAKKNSMKQMTRGSQSQTMSPNNITFGRMQTPDVRSQRDRELPTQEKLGQHLKAVDMMFKELENNNKFTIGNKKIELKYEGDRRNGVRHGNGVLFYSNGLCYEGQFKEGVRHGYGILKFNHIQIYNGDWLNDQMEGQGKIRNCAIINRKKSACSSQSPLGKWISYSGEFKASRFEGSGTLYLQGGQKFVGKFGGGVASGDGAIYRKNGEVEEGIWKNNVLVERESLSSY